MRGFKKVKSRDEAELNITSFMNLMIVLVPVLLLSMVFSHISVLKLQLPQAVDQVAADLEKNYPLELEIRSQNMAVLYPPGQILKEFPLIDGQYDFIGLKDYLKQLKAVFQDKGKDKEAISILAESHIDYQTIVTTMDTVRSYQAVVAASVVDAELFPQVSLGDAPKIIDESVNPAEQAQQ
jgi:biopolymer transport protein ExbD